MMFLGIGIIRTEKCWPNSPTYSTDVGVSRGWGRAQITVDILGREAKKVEKHCLRYWGKMLDFLKEKAPPEHLSLCGCVWVDVGVCVSTPSPDVCVP